MQSTTIPSMPDAGFQELVAKGRNLEGVKLSEVIPSEYFTIRVWRGLLGFFASYALWGAATWAVSVAPHWSLYVPLWLLAGLGGWGLHCIAHDCGHGSFSRSQRLNYFIGHLALLPLIYPFHAWRHVHNLHHANTNSLEQDTDWRPVDAATFKRMSLFSRLVYGGTRSAMFWMGTVHYWAVSGFRPNFFPQRRARDDVRRSIVFVVIATALGFSLLYYYTGVIGLLKYFLAPWLAIHAWFSVTTLMHHTAEDLPFLSHRDWTKNGSKILLTIDYRYPAWLHFFTHNISIHTAHHVAPKLPFYNLQKAQKLLKETYPDAMRERNFTFGALWRIVTRCHLYDPVTGYYKAFTDKAAAAEAETGSQAAAK